MGQPNRRTYVSPSILAVGLAFPALVLIGFAAFLEFDRDWVRSCLVAYCAFVVPLLLAGMASTKAPRDGEYPRPVGHHNVFTLAYDPKSGLF